MKSKELISLVLAVICACSSTGMSSANAVSFGDIVYTNSVQDEEFTLFTSGVYNNTIDWEVYKNSSGLVRRIVISGTGAVDSGIWTQNGIVGANIENVVIEEGITDISNLFSSDYAPKYYLKSISLPSTLTGTVSLDYCSKLSSVEFPDGIGITEISMKFCSLLEEITIPDSVETIGSDSQSFALSGCSNLKSITLPNNKKFNTIYERMFMDCKSLESITIPNSVIRINDGAFSGCTNLQKVILPTNLVKIGAGVFDDCISLSELTLPDTITWLGNFRNVTALNKLDIPAKCTYIGGFENCTSLEAINVDSSNTEYYSVDGVLFKRDSLSPFGDDILYYPAAKKDKGFVIPNITKSVHTFCENPYIEVIAYPKSNNISASIYNDFNGCKNLEAVYIPDNYNSIIVREETLPSLEYIYGESGSYAEKFANEKGYIFIDGYPVIESEQSTTTTTTSTTTTSTATSTSTTTTKATTTSSTNTTTNDTNTATPPTTLAPVGTVDPRAYNDYSLQAIEESPIKPKLTVTKSVISADDTNYTQEVQIFVEGADRKYCNTRLHVFYDDRLVASVNPWGNIKVLRGQENLDGFVTDLGSGIMPGMSGLMLTTTGTSNDGCDGLLWTINFELPSNAQAGDVFPIDIAYFYSDTLKGDFFYDYVVESDSSKLMSAYVFTLGTYTEVNPYPGDDYLPAGSTYDGYIAIEGKAEETTTTTQTTSATTMTTTSTSTSNNVTTGTTINSATTTTTSTATTTTTFSQTTTSATISPSVTTTSAGVYNAVLKYVQYDDHVEISGCNTSYTGEIVIPSSINGLPVTKVGGLGSSHMSSVIISEGVEEIEANAFYWCSNLNSVTLPDSLKKIDYSAFAYCVLTGVTIPANVEYIGSNAFYGSGSSSSNGLKYLKVLSTDCEFYNDWYVVPETCTIYGYSGSTAQNYANTYGYTFADISTFSEDMYGETSTSTTTTTTQTTAQIGYMTTTKARVEVGSITECTVLGFSDPSEKISEIDFDVVFAGDIEVIDKYVNKAGSNLYLKVKISVPETASLGFYQYSLTTNKVIDVDGNDIVNQLWSSYINTTSTIEVVAKGSLPTTAPVYTLPIESTTTTASTTTATTTTTPPITTEPIAVALGDVNQDGMVDASDASDVLKAYAELSTGGTPDLTEKQKTAADVNKDGMIDASDASDILRFYAYLSTGGSGTMEEFYSQ